MPDLRIGSLETRGRELPQAHMGAREFAAWYDGGMTVAKIAITLPRDQLARVQRAVRRGRADSVSQYIARALVEQDREESLRALVRDLVAQHGEPTREEEAWAKRVLRRKRTG